VLSEVENCPYYRYLTGQAKHIQWYPC